MKRILILFCVVILLASCFVCSAQVYSSDVPSYCPVAGGAWIAVTTSQGSSVLCFSSDYISNCFGFSGRTGYDLLNTRSSTVNGTVYFQNATSFYDNPLLKDSIILLDEVSNLWNNRSWGKWTEDDTDFFNFLGKNNTRVFMAIQYYDMIDLNVKRNLDATWFVEKSIFPNVSIVECDVQDVRKVEDLNTHVLDSRYHKINYDSVVIEDGRYYFRRKPWYRYFLTLYQDDRVVTKWPLQTWNELVFTAEQSLPDSDPGSDEAKV